MKTKRTILAILVSLLALAGCGSTEKKASGTEVTVGLTYVPDVQFAPFYVAEKKGYFTRHGIDVKLRHHGAQESFFGALKQGREDVVVAGGDEMMQARSTGVDVRNWATMYQDYPVRLIVRGDSSIHSPADLRGKTVGLPGKHGENHFSLLAMLKASGMTESDVDVKYIGYTQAAALSSKKVDAVVGFVNSDAIAIQAQGVEVRSIEMVQGGLPLVGAGLGSKDGFLTGATEAVPGRMKAALAQAVAFMREHPEQTLDIVREYVPALSDPKRRRTAAEVLTASIQLYGKGEFGAQDPARWEAMAGFMQSNGLLERPVAAADAYRDVGSQR